MQKQIVCLFILFLLGFAANVAVKAEQTSRTDIVPVYPELINESVECIQTGISTVPPWIQLNPPWDPNITIPDVYSRNDQLISMDIDVNGRIYVAYNTPWTGTGAAVRYGWGLATSTDQGITWDNRVYRLSNTNYTVFNPEISITDDGKIWLWGTLHQAAGGTTYQMCTAFMRSRATCYNNPDSLYGFSLFSALQYRVYPECVTWGNGNQLAVIQYTVDRTGTSDSVMVIFSYDSTAWYAFTLRPAGTYPGMTSISLDVVGTDTILNHAIEYIDSTNGDYDVVCYLDTLNGSGNFYGWSTANTYDDRYPSIFADQGAVYIAFQSDDGTGNPEIIFTYSQDYGQNWDMALQNISNDGAPDLFPRVNGFSSSVGCAWNHGLNTTFFDYSITYGIPGTWTGVPEIVTDNATADSGYHCVSLLYTDAYYYCAWEDIRNFATDSIDILTSRRTTPIGIKENTKDRKFVMLNACPNPFARTTAITCGNTAGLGSPKLAIYNTAGRLVRTLSVPSGRTAACITWDGRNDEGKEANAGVYFCRFESNGSVRTEKLIRLK
ncbi:MAG TPA: T9SS type A sorting domain-containing protein [bacterium]